MVPCPLPPDSTLTSPPYTSQISFTKTSPKPWPLLLLVPDVCFNLPNPVNIVCIFFLSIPIPVSLTVALSLFDSSSYQTLIEMEPEHVNFKAFLSRLMKTYLRRCSSPSSIGIRSNLLSFVSSLMFLNISTPCTLAWNEIPLMINCGAKMVQVWRTTSNTSNSL